MSISYGTTGSISIPTYGSISLPGSGSTWAVQMTAAASGSSGISVPDSDEYDLAASDFALPVRFAYQEGVADTKAEENLLTFPEDFGNAAWNKTATTVTTNAIAAPDGTLTADLFIPDTSNTFHRVFGAQLTASGALNLLFFAKTGGYPILAFRQDARAAGTGPSAVFDISAGTVLGTFGAEITSTSIISLGDGWYACLASINDPGDFRYGLHVMSSWVSGDVISTTFAGDGTSGVYAWGASLNSNSLRAYIPGRTAAFTNLVYWLYLKYQDGNNYWGYRINSSGMLEFVAAVNGLMRINVQSTAALTSADGAIIEGVFTCERESSGAAGEGNFYVNGAQLGASVAITAATPVDISNTGSLYIMGTDAIQNDAVSVRNIALNFAPTAAQVSTLYSSGIPEEWMWGSNVSLNLSTWQNNPGVPYTVFSGASSTGYHAENDGSGNALSNIDDAINYEAGIKYRVRWVASVTGQLPQFVASTNTDGVPISATGTVSGTMANGVNVIEFTPTVTVTGSFVIFNLSGATTDFDITEFEIIRLGATLALLPETLPISPALEWPDSANGNDATLPAAGATKVNIRA